MVQYILTPWRDRQELLLVRRQFYPAGPWLKEHHRMGSRDPHPAPLPHDDIHHRSQQQLKQKQDQQHEAVARVSMWVQRGNCPHMVESTALLMAALLSDEEHMVSAAAPGNAMASSAYAVRAAYSTAFSRFVTGLLDGQQDKQRKQSMYSLAKTVGLPATFVELRHQSTHEQLPSLSQLRAAARKALVWIWNYYWKNLSSDDLDDPAGAFTCEDAVQRYLRVEDEDGTRLAQLRRVWEGEQLVECVERVKGAVLGNQAYLKCVSLARQLRAQMDDEDDGGEVQSLAATVPEQVTSDVEPELEPTIEPSPQPGSGWSVYQGPWTPKPIGIV